jgi:hypothetical protein
MHDADGVEASRREPEHQNLVVLVTKESDGYTFKLHPLSARRLLKAAPGKLLPTISVAYDVRSDFERIRGSIFEELVPVLTRLSLEDVRSSGGIQFVDADSNAVMWTLPQDPSEAPGIDPSR